MAYQKIIIQTEREKTEWENAWKFLCIFRWSNSFAITATILNSNKIENILNIFENDLLELFGANVWFNLLYDNWKFVRLQRSQFNHEQIQQTEL